MALPRALAALTAVSAFGFAMMTESDRQKKLKDGDVNNGSNLQQPPVIKKELTAEEFNAQQDQVAIKKCFDALEVRQKAKAADKTQTNNAEICPIELFRYLSCPYCAKVKGVLDFHDVPHSTVTVDPITNNHMPQTPYSMTPQIQLVVNPSAPIGSAARGPFLVDSDLIVSALARPLGYQKQMADPRVKETLTFISTAYSRATFVTMYSELNRAMESYRHCVPDHYQYLPLRVAGSLGMRFISTKAFAKINEHFPLKSENETIDSVVGRQTEWFSSRIPTGKPFHGGDRPDIADIEMFAMSMGLLHNNLCAPLINKGSFQDWATRMAPLMPNRSAANYGCEMPRV